MLLTVQTAKNLRVFDADEKYLWEILELQFIFGEYTLEATSGSRRNGRQANMEVRSFSVTLRVPNPWTENNVFVTMYAVQTREVGTTPKVEKPIEWMLFTNCHDQADGKDTIKKSQ